MNIISTDMETLKVVFGVVLLALTFWLAWWASRPTRCSRCDKPVTKVKSHTKNEDGWLTIYECCGVEVRQMIFWEDMH